MAYTSNQEGEERILSRLADLQDQGDRQSRPCFLGFLDEFQPKVCRNALRKTTLSYRFFGGYEDAERVFLGLSPWEDRGLEDGDFPIRRVEAAYRRQDKPGHRDFLGARRNLGGDRSTRGDSTVGEKEAYLFCLDSIAGFLCENLTKVRHTHVKCEVADTCQVMVQEEPEMVTVQVQSLRVDAVLAKVCGLSREKSLDLFQAGKVFVGGRLCENNSRLLKPGETVNARGYGKFTMQGEARKTKKGKLSVEMAVYR